MKIYSPPFRSFLTLFALLPVWAMAGQVDINSADAKTLARELDGIGLARAYAIVDYREKNGPFKDAADLTKVKGIPMKVVDANRENIRLGGDKAAKPKEKAKPDKSEKADNTPEH